MKISQLVVPFLPLTLCFQIFQETLLNVRELDIGRFCTHILFIQKKNKLFEIFDKYLVNIDLFSTEFRFIYVDCLMLSNNF